ncbi:putative toxin-antitoxin system toxin component, PIN family [Paraburkholderia kururiensis]|uniref:Toxin-antitoxin system toxin component, PIN family n=1 Tax=Paraburkholderia kururiensis TaxID=984307 RepID=A0ABZ0WIP9_9BURK|nr:putative toxin-antitoxin system toxin component, PIN family [Paraburkholderia kururiensis]WQD77185.1 putative toxin-antitoxin system toxin component, PIN family [Paraburkholderia kururiensis]
MPGSQGSTPTRPPHSTRALRVVLDSNVWIDILVFDDPHTRPIHAALEAGALEAVVDERCFAELARVLEYPQFAQRSVDKAAALANVERLTLRVERALPTEGARPLPQCKDRDDQKFIELAHGSGAAWLVSKDRAVLKLAKRMTRDFGLQIAPPAQFVAACVALAESAGPNEPVPA